MIPAWKQRLSERTAVVLVALGMTVLLFIELLAAPWRPWFFVFAGLALVIPLWLGAFRFGDVPGSRLLGLGLAVFLGLAMQIAAGVIIVLIYPDVLASSGVSDIAISQPYFSLDAALAELFTTAAERLSASLEAVQGLYLAFIFLWAGLGEELFYRGYVQGKLQAAWGALNAVTISALYFAIRHAVQLTPLAPNYPWGAAAVWTFLSFLAGLVFGILFHRSRSLYLPIAVHYVFNLIPLVGLLSEGSQ